LFPDQAQGYQDKKTMATTRLKTLYQETIVPKLVNQFQYTNVHQVPKLVKVTINRGLGEAAQNAKSLEASINEIAVVTGQKPVVTRAKKAIAGFKIRQGMPVGRGNYTLGVREQLIFPEVEYDSIDQVRGMDISIITTAKNDEEGRALLKELGMPFRDQ